MEQILDYPSSGQRSLKYAGFWIRFVAYIIDYIVLTIFSFIVMSVIGINAFTDPAAIDYAAFAMAYLLIFIAWLAYYVVMEASSRQGTLGKMAVGIKVGNANGGRISLANALGRYFSKLISAITLMIGYMMAGWDSKKQALHDKIADTYVFYN